MIKTFLNPISTMKIFLFAGILFFCFSFESSRNQDRNKLLFAKDNLVAWCIVPFDSMNRSPEERATMLNELGITQFAYDWRIQHLPTFAEEIDILRKHHIKLKAVWFSVEGGTGKILNESNEFILKTIKDKKAETELWLSFSADFFKDLSDDEKIKKGVESVTYIEKRAKEAGCKLCLYNHGDWFGEPENQIKIIKGTGSKNIGIVYNFHHGHEQLDRYSSLLKMMMPYLSTVNINGMRKEGPKIISLGGGDLELGMLQELKKSGFSGSIGILGHTENEDIRKPLERNLNGLKSLLIKMKDQDALNTY
jgi:hypothetical protein